MKIHFHIEQSKIINVQAQQLKNRLTDLNQFLLWSPWKCLDDQAQANINNPAHQEGHALHWHGPIIGEGIQTINKISDFSVESGLQFIKPFKSFSPTKYELKPHGENTELTWTMEGTLPIFLFFLKKFMTVMLTRDLERGLDRLKELCEEGKVNSTLSQVEKAQFNAFYYQGIEGQCALKDIAFHLRQAFDQINSDLESKKIVDHAGVLAVYHDINPMKGTTHFTAGVYFHSEPKKIEGYRQGKIETHEALKLISQGPYHHLKSAWGKIFSYQRINKLKVNSKIPMVEIMLNDPNGVAKEDLLTEIRLPIK